MPDYINSQTIAYPFGHPDLQILVARNAAQSVEYIGRARPGAATSAAEWQIGKIAYDANGDFASLKFAGGTNTYSKVWDNRAAYSYS